MNICIKDIYRALSPLKNRIHLNKFITCLAAGIIAAGGLSLALCTISLFIPVVFLAAKIRLMCLACFFLSCISGIILRPGNTKVLKTADSLGLKERLVTAYELRNDNSQLAAIQRSDAFNAARNVDYKSLYPVRFPLKLGIAALILAILSAGIYAIPTGSKERAAKAEAVKKEIRAQVEKLDNERKAYIKESTLSPDKLREFNKKIDELLKELKKSNTEEQALKALSKTKNELQELKTKDPNSELLKAAREFRQNPVAESLSNALKNGSKDDLAKTMQELKKKIDALSTEERKKLAEETKKFLSKIPDSKEVMKNLEQLAQAIASGNNSAVEGAVSNLEGTISSMLSGNNQSNTAMQQTLDKMSEALKEAKYDIAALDDNDSNQSAQSSSEDGSQGGNGKGDGSQSGSGNGNSNGNGNGSSSGNGGGGAGKGTTNKDSGYAGQESGYASRDQGEKNIKDFESIYVPERLGGGAKQSQVKGHKGKSGQSQWKETDVPVEKGSIIPYGQVLDKYRDEAVTGIQGDTVPPVMKDVVRDYFSSLE